MRFFVHATRMECRYTYKRRNETSMSTQNFVHYYTLLIACSLTPICRCWTQHVSNGLETCYGAYWIGPLRESLLMLLLLRFRWRLQLLSLLLLLLLLLLPCCRWWTQHVSNELETCYGVYWEPQASSIGEEFVKYDCSACFKFDVDGTPYTARNTSASQAMQDT